MPSQQHRPVPPLRTLQSTMKRSVNSTLLSYVVHLTKSFTADRLMPPSSRPGAAPHSSSAVSQEALQHASVYM